MKQGMVYYQQEQAGIISETDEGYSFRYLDSYLSSSHPHPVSLTLPLTDKPYSSSVLFPFFDGLIPEGWLLDIAERNWKLNGRDRFALLLACCKDCIGAVSVIPINEIGDEQMSVLL